MRLQALYQLGEGIILMGKSSQSGPAHLLKKRFEGWIAGKIGAEDDRIDEVTHHSRKARQASARGGRPHENILLTGMPGKQHLKCGQHERVEGSTVKPCERR